MKLDALLDRFLACHAEITDIRRAFRLAPERPLDVGDLPALFMLVGPGTSAPGQQAGSYVRTRTFLARIAVRSLPQSVDTSNDGSAALTAVVPLIDVYEAYWVAHPRMHTEALPELGLYQDITFTDSGPTLIEIGGDRFAGVEFNFSVAQRMPASRTSFVRS